MEIAYLKEFLELVDKLNFTEAAGSMYMSQPLLSKHVKILEKELGAKLFERSSKQVELTDFGRRYRKYAEEMVRLYERSDKWRKEYIRKNESTILIGLPESQELYEVRDHFYLFGKLHPEYTIEIEEMPSYRLLSKYEQGALNLFLTGMTLDIDASKLSFGYVEAAQGQIRACVRSDHPLAAGGTITAEDLPAVRGTITAEDLEDERVVLPPKDTVFQQFIENAFYKTLGYRKEFIYGGYNIAKTLAEAGTCVALMQEEALSGAISDELTVLDFSPAIRYTRGLGYRRNALSEAEKVYLEFARDQLHPATQSQPVK